MSRSSRSHYGIVILPQCSEQTATPIVIPVSSDGGPSMTSNQELDGQGTTKLSPFDLKQIKDAVSQLRAASPKSALADLVEEKIRALENIDPIYVLEEPHSLG